MKGKMNGKNTMIEKYILDDWKRNLKKKMFPTMSCETIEKLSGYREEDWLFEQQGEAIE